VPGRNVVTNSRWTDENDDFSLLPCYWRIRWDNRWHCHQRSRYNLQTYYWQWRRVLQAGIHWAVWDMAAEGRLRSVPGCQGVNHPRFSRRRFGRILKLTSGVKNLIPAFRANL